MTIKRTKPIIAAIAAALACGVAIAPAAYAKPASPCAIESKLLKATIAARQKGVAKESMDLLAAQLEGDSKAMALGVISKVYSKPEFEKIPAAAAGAFFSATCAR